MMGANIVTSGSQYRLQLIFLCFGSFRMDRGYFEIFNKIVHVFLNLTIDSSTRHSVIASIFISLEI